VRVGLPHDEVATVGIDLAALVARHHACRNPGGAQKNHEGAGVVLAEPALALEEEAVDGLVPKERGRQRVHVGLVVETREHRGNEGAIGAHSAAQFARELDRARVAVGRKLQVLAPLEVADRGIALAERGALRIAYRLRDQRSG
jgi:hypothetical protein